MNEYQKLTADLQDRMDLAVEFTAVQVADLIAKQLHDRDMSRSDFARLLDVTPGRVTQILDGDANLQLRSIARALAVFDLVLDVDVVRMSSLSCPESWEEAALHSTSVGHCGLLNKPSTGERNVATPANSNYALAA